MGKKTIVLDAVQEAEREKAKVAGKRMGYAIRELLELMTMDMAIHFLRGIRYILNEEWRRRTGG